MSLSPRILLEPEPPGRDIALMVTRRCNMTCGHCSVESSPDVRGEPGEAELLEWVRAAAAAGVRSIRLTGGEPMLRPSVILRLVRECRRLGMATSISTNGSWGRNSARARRQLRALERAGLGSIALSYDTYHAAFQGPAPIVNIARASGDQASVPVRISLVRGTDEADLAKLVGDLEGAPSTTIRVYDLQPVGRARELPATLYRGELQGFCSACAFPAITDDGRLVACNGPSYFEKAGSPLVLGSLGERPLADLIEQHRRDPILDTIRTKGPVGLRDELRRIPGFETFPFRTSYSGICDLCHHVTRDGAAVAALRERLGRPEAVAERLALWQVIDGSRKGGTLSTGYVNGPGACRLFLRAALDPSNGIGPDAELVLGRADVDWRAIADYLCGSGLARPLLPIVADRTFNRWAPAFFRDALEKRGIADGMRELVQRDALQHIADGLRALGGRGVLLKGSAFLLAGRDGRSRYTHDIDILVDPELAVRLRDHLIAAGFEGQPGDSPSTFQHLEPITYQGVSVEIHTRIMAPFWGLPERAMLADARPIPGSDMFSMLGPEGLILHAVTHASAAFFSNGLKCAWDVMTVLRSGDAIDWERLAAWANMTRLRRAFWVPMRLFADELGVPVPASLLRHAPVDPGSYRIRVVARHRLFRSTDTMGELDALTKAGMMLLLHDSFAGRLRYLAAKISWRGSRPSTWSGTARRARRADVLHQAWRSYRRYRRALRRPAVAVQGADS